MNIVTNYSYSRFRAVNTDEYVPKHVCLLLVPTSLLQERYLRPLLVIVRLHLDIFITFDKELNSRKNQRKLNIFIAHDHLFCLN